METGVEVQDRGMVGLKWVLNVRDSGMVKWRLV